MIQSNQPIAPAADGRIAAGAQPVRPRATEAAA